MHRPGALMSVVRHEGWHAAQDCMAGSIDNSMIAIIHNEEDVPKYGRKLLKERTNLCLKRFHGRRRRCGQVRQLE